MNCEHPDHVDGVSCEDRAVGCHKDCECCMGCRHNNNNCASSLLDSLLSLEFGRFCRKCGVCLTDPAQTGSALIMETIKRRLDEMSPEELYRRMNDDLEEYRLYDFSKGKRGPVRKPAP